MDKHMERHVIFSSKVLLIRFFLDFKSVLILDLCLAGEASRDVLIGAMSMSFIEASIAFVISITHLVTFMSVVVTAFEK